MDFEDEYYRDYPVPRRSLNHILANKNEKGYAQFLEAIQNGDLEQAELIFNAKKINPDITSATGETALHKAAREGHVDCIDFLLKNGADINKTERRRKTPIHLAASSGQLGSVKRLIKGRAELDVIDKYGRTPLMWATFYGKESLVAEFLSAGATIKSKSNWHALHEACKGGYLSIAKLLIERGAPVNNPHEFKGCAPWSPLHIAVRQGHLDCVNLLLDAGADVHSRNAGGHTPLHEAAYRGYDEILLRLLRQNANPNGKSNQKRTPLHEACQRGNALCATLLLDAGSKPNAQDMVYDTPLHLALRTQLPPVEVVPIVEVLLQYGASPTMLGKGDEMPCDIAKDTGKMSCLEILLDAAEKPLPLVQFCKVCIRKKLKITYNTDKVDRLPISVGMKHFLKENAAITESL